MSDYFDSVASTWDLNPMRLERAMATAEMVRNAPLQHHQSLIDFGGGTGSLGACLKDDFAEITIVDSSQAMLVEAERKIRELSIHNISTSAILPKNKLFSAMVSLMVLHHIQDLDGFFNKASRCIESGGTLMIADLYKEDGSFHQHDPSFAGHNGFDLQQLSENLNRYGFEVVQQQEFFRVKKSLPNGNEAEFPLFFLTSIKL